MFIYIHCYQTVPCSPDEPLCLNATTEPYPTVAGQAMNITYRGVLPITGQFLVYTTCGVYTCACTRRTCIRHCTCIITLYVGDNGTILYKLKNRPVLCIDLSVSQLHSLTDSSSPDSAPPGTAPPDSAPPGTAPPDSPPNSSYPDSTPNTSPTDTASSDSVSSSSSSSSPVLKPSPSDSSSRNTHQLHCRFTIYASHCQKTLYNLLTDWWVLLIVPVIILLLCVGGGGELYMLIVRLVYATVL